MGHVVGDWAGRSVLVTGAAGFLGEWTARTLATAGARVTGIDIAWRDEQQSLPLTIEELDCRDAPAMSALLSRDHIDTVIHLAAQSLVGPAHEHPVPTFQNNIEATWTVLDACRGNPDVTSIVVASSDKAYGDAEGEEYDESTPLSARNPYDVSKACADLIAQSYAAAYAMPIAVTRCGNLYGGGDRNWSRIIPGTIQSLLAGERPVIRSDGTCVRDYLYVEDAVAGVLTLAANLPRREELRGEAFNFAAGARYSVMEIVAKIMHIMDVNVEPDIRNVATGEIAEQRLSASKARGVLGWVPETDIDTGLTRAAAWYREHLQ